MAHSFPPLLFVKHPSGSPTYVGHNYDRHLSPIERQTLGSGGGELVT